MLCLCMSNVLPALMIRLLLALMILIVRDHCVTAHDPSI